MKKSFFLFFTFLICFHLSKTIAQENYLMVLNGANLIMTGGDSSSPIWLVVNQKSENGIKHIDGFIHSEGQYNYVKWKADDEVGEYVFPFGVDDGTDAYIPFTFKKTNGVTDIIVSTWATDVQNNPKPEGVEDMAEENDPESFVLDRFWNIQAEEVTADLTFSYRGLENTTLVPNAELSALRWNGSIWTEPTEMTYPGVTTGIGVAGPYSGISDFSYWMLRTPRKDDVSTSTEMVEDDIIVYSKQNEVNIIRSSNEKAQITITNLLGQRVFEMETNEKEISIPLKNHRTAWVAIVNVRENQNVKAVKVLIY